MRTNRKRWVLPVLACLLLLVPAGCGDAGIPDLREASGLVCGRLY